MILQLPQFCSHDFIYVCRRIGHGNRNTKELRRTIFFVVFYRTQIKSGRIVSELFSRNFQMSLWKPFLMIRYLLFLFHLFLWLCPKTTYKIYYIDNLLNNSKTSHLTRQNVRDKTGDRLKIEHRNALHIKWHT